jgi:DNA polymerase-3 subunit delta
VRGLIASLGKDAERVAPSAEQLSADAALLFAEAHAPSMFGGQRYIFVRLQGRELQQATPAIERQLDAELPGDPVIISAAGTAPKTALPKRIEASKQALLCACYPPSADDVKRAISAHARTWGLRLADTLADRIMVAVSNDAMLARQEVDRLALYKNAAPDAPVTAELADYRQLRADNDEEDLFAILHAALAGKVAALTQQLAQTQAIGLSEVGLVRVMLGHLHKLRVLRIRADNGESINRIVNDPRSGLHYTVRDTIEAQLRIWSGADIARLIERIGDLEIALKGPGGKPAMLTEQEMLMIAQRAATIAGRALR